MSGQAQELSVWARLATRPPRALALLALALLVLPGCAGGMNLDRLGTDSSIVTGSIDAAPKQPDTRASDEAAIRAAIASWSPEEPPRDAVPWVNANTGSSGAITRIADSSDGRTRCRRFSASRESFGGMSRYSGKACTAAGGPWIVNELNQG